MLWLAYSTFHKPLRSQWTTCFFTPQNTYSSYLLMSAFFQAGINFHLQIPRSIKVQMSMRTILDSHWRLVQGGRVEGCMLTPSYESTRITTNCRTIIDRKTLELTKKDTPHPKTKEKLQWDGRRGTIKINQIPWLLGGWLTNWRTLIPQGSTYWSEGSEPHVRLHNLGVRQWEDKPQRIGLWRLEGFDCRTSTGLGETETPLLEGTHRVVCSSGPRGKEQWPLRRLNKTYLLVLKGLRQRRGVAVAHHRDKDIGSRSSGKYSLAWALPESTISPTKEPVASVLGYLRWNKQQGGNPAPPINRQAY